MTWAQRRMTVHTFEPVSRAEVAHLLRRDSALARRWHRRLDRLPGMRMKWSVLDFEVWCSEVAFDMDDVSDPDSWLGPVHATFFDEWQQRAVESCIVGFSKTGFALAAVAALGCAVAALIGAPNPLILAGGLSVAALLGCTWSRRRLLCGPSARGLRRSQAITGRSA